MKLAAFLATCLSITLIAGCGGGGGGGSTTSTSSTPGAAQGAYFGSFVSASISNPSFQTLVLENDEYWTLYGSSKPSTGGLVVYGMLQGQGTSNNGSFTSGSIKDYYYTGIVASGSLSATYQPGTSFNGTLSEGGTNTSFSGVALPSGSTSYNYNTPANLADVSGSWLGTTLYGSSFSLSVSGGTWTGIESTGCASSGTIAPRASGKNVFDVTFTNAVSTACGSTSGVTGRGVAVYSALTNGQHQIIVPAISSNRAFGTVLFATR